MWKQIIGRHSHVIDFAMLPLSDLLQEDVFCKLLCDLEVAKESALLKKKNKNKTKKQTNKQKQVYNETPCFAIRYFCIFFLTTWHYQQLLVHKQLSR